MYVHILILIPVLALGFTLGALWMGHENKMATKEILEALKKNLN